MKSRGLESTEVWVATESPTVAGDYIIPLHPYFLYTMLYAGGGLKINRRLWEV